MQLAKQSGNRSWLACWLQDRRRNRASAVHLQLWSDGHGHLIWWCSIYWGYGLTICHSDDGVTWNDFYDGANTDDPGKDASGDPGYFRIALVDGDGFVIPPYSNIVHSDGL